MQQQGHRNTPTDLTREQLYTLNYLTVTQQKGGTCKKNTGMHTLRYLTMTYQQ
jgi:hypothetical protein